jgi:3-oxoacyl-[acyl-carrier protein] reductase
MSSLAGKTAMVTGASRGIGKAIAFAMATEGATVALVARSSTEETRQLILDAGAKAFSYAADVADESQVETLFAEAIPALGGLDILVNNAGVILEKPLLETDTSDFDWVMNINLRGTFMVGREAIRRMVTENGGGRVINVASDLAFVGREQFSAYCASKAAVIALTKSWAKEFAPRVLVNALCPGPVDTDMLAIENMSPEWRKKEEDIPLQRVGQPEEIAGLAVFLAGPSATFITGQGFGVNGGSVMP